MFRVAVILNDNEVSHSDFADVISILKKPMTLGQKKKEYYDFFAFNKYNIERLLRHVNDDLFLLRFDSLIIATNATDDKELYSMLIEAKELIGKFIETGKGIFISSQKKLSNKTKHTINSISFLPDKYDYLIYDRPEKSSAEGTVSTINTSDILLNYPSTITDSLIEYHCTNNQFMVHWYRSHIIPKDELQYIPLLVDDNQTIVPDVLNNKTETYRKILLRTGNFTERVVITSMALDWASHDELIENILIYITEGISQFAFVKTDQSCEVIDSYILRAKAAKFSIREYINPSIDTLLSLPHGVFIFAPENGEEIISQFWNQCNCLKRKVIIYQLERIDGGFKLSQFSTETSIDRIKLEVSNWLYRIFIPTNFWGNSIWTYNYALIMMLELDLDYSAYLEYIYEDLSKHFCDNIGNRIGSYDRVINATCMMLEILHYIFLPLAEIKKDGVYYKHPIYEVYRETKDWIADKILIENINSLINQDIIYILYALFKINYIDEIDDLKKISLCLETKKIINIYRNTHYLNVSNVVLCKILYLIFAIYKAEQLPKSTAIEQIIEITQLLNEKQQINGEWRNISETSETVRMLLSLKAIDESLFQKINGVVNNCIIDAIEYLYINYNRSEYNWSADIGTTSKAMHAIGLFDKVYNFSANDFFQDVSFKHHQYLDCLNLENNNFALHQYINCIQEKETKIRCLTQENSEKTVQICNLNKKNKHNKISLYIAYTFALILIFFTALLIIGLTDHKEIISELFNHWRSEFIFCFIGIIISLIFLAIHNYLKKKTLD